mmetsp:Transcript_28508/g.33794  ORF Transcript_28508/g.33794 Transcript_28508/m.33794 type:complete len:240 (+) Transcript_28508:110-829(+)|eukprot:CAMPEP_0198268288 /NCGR_PEP_ID=MMETSP1447-20131203/36552_1 /TAXON_ID=420782 /ORGANISM="Chaetoceros dichaeta, Strain CCMP1751" /LENGTH=239 /DNA_ID=CAMNT_0043959245 /DNA_START=41 /DNA_END=760 /DNA_ORIENTATION=+
MPPLLTFVARVSDGLPLVASFAPTQENLEEQKKQAKDIVRGLSGRSTAKMSIETTSSTIFHYLIKDNICYLTLTEGSYPKRLAFLYLEEVADAFIEFILSTHNTSTNNNNHHHNNGSDNTWRQIIETTPRPYAFIKCEPILQKKQRDFVDPTSSQNSDKLSRDLSDIHSIMRQNISQVLDRGEKLDHVSQISSELMSESKKFKWGAKKLTWQARIAQYAPVVAIVGFVVFVLGLKFYVM